MDFDTTEKLETFLADIDSGDALDAIIFATVYKDQIAAPLHYSIDGEDALKLMDDFVHLHEYTHANVSSSYWHGHHFFVSMSDNHEWIYNHSNHGMHGGIKQPNRPLEYGMSTMQMAICRGVLRATLGYDFYKVPLFGGENSRIKNPYTWLGRDYAQKKGVLFNDLIENAMRGYLEDAGEA